MGHLLGILTFVLLFLLTGCGRTEMETLPEVIELDVSNSAFAVVAEESGVDPEASGEDSIVDAEDLLDAFLTGEIPAISDVDNPVVIMFGDLPADEEDFSSYSVGERIDLDNDGAGELIVNGPYGGLYLDARDGKVYVLAQGEGTAGELSYTHYDNAVWVVHCDISHMGRQMYWLTQYDGDGNIVDEFQFSAEYWDSPDSQYDENSDFTFRDKKISMEEYEALGKEIFGW